MCFQIMSRNGLVLGYGGLKYCVIVDGRRARCLIACRHSGRPEEGNSRASL